MTQTSILRLKKQEDRRLRGGHLWVYSNEVDVRQTPLTAFKAGELVRLETHSSHFIAYAYVNPHSLICARVLSRQQDEIVDKDFFARRLKRALYLREALFSGPFYRLVFGESDLLPGLIIDRYNDTLVVQITTAGMEAQKMALRDALLEVIKPAAILLRNDSNVRTLEGLPKTVEALYGNPAKTVELIEHETRFIIPVWEGQKTGWFYDQRYNRARLQHYVKNKRVLDVFSYIGAWSVQAARCGASEVYAIDSSAQALNYLQNNAQLNNVTRKINTIQEDAFKALQQLRDAEEKFDVVIIDPPAFMKRRKDIKEGFIAYRRLNELAVRLLTDNGVLISASCSMHLQREDLIEILRMAGCTPPRHLQILEHGQQAADHPVHPAIPETNYLKAFFARVNLSES